MGEGQGITVSKSLRHATLKVYLSCHLYRTKIFNSISGKKAKRKRKGNEVRTSENRERAGSERAARSKIEIVLEFELSYLRNIRLHDIKTIFSGVGRGWFVVKLVGLAQYEFIFPPSEWIPEQCYGV